MFVSLAGGCAVKTLFGNETIGNQSDAVNWENIAKQYLSSFDHSFQWYTQPNNKAEGAINADTLRTLKTDQLKVVEKFIRRNESLIFSIADELIQSETHKIDTHQSLNYLSKVR